MKQTCKQKNAANKIKLAKLNSTEKQNDSAGEWVFCFCNKKEDREECFVLYIKRNWTLK